VLAHNINTEQLQDIRGARCQFGICLSLWLLWTCK